MIQDCRLRFPEPVRSNRQTEYTAFFRNFRLLVNKRDILRCLRNLELDLSSAYPDRSRAPGGHQSGESDFVALRDTLTRACSSLLEYATGIEDLKLTNVFIDEDFARVVLGLPHLHTLTIQECKFELSTWNANPSDLSLPTSSSIRNLCISFDHGIQSLSRPGALLPYMPSIRYLSHTGALGAAQIIVSGQDFEAKDNHSQQLLRNVERMNIRALQYVDLEYAIAAMLDAGVLAKPPCPLALTHLRLSAPFCRSEQTFRDVVRALAGAPVRSLCLKGRLPKEPVLLDEIAKVCPRLEELTLVYGSAPSGSIEDNASCLASLEKLRFFRWNLKMEHLAHPKSFGRDAAAPQSVQCEDCTNIFEMFTAHTPSLEILDFVSQVVLQKLQDGSVDVFPYSQAQEEAARVKIGPKAPLSWPMLRFIPRNSSQFMYMSSS